MNESPFVAEKTRARVLKAIAELGYRPNQAARRLATRRSRVIGMVGSHITYYGPAQVMLSVEETAKRHGYNLMFAGVESASRAQVAAAIDDLFEHQVDGLVLGVRVEGAIDAIRKLCRGVPFVALDTNAAPDVPTVIVDQQYGNARCHPAFARFGSPADCFYHRAAGLVCFQRAPKGLGKGPQTRGLGARPLRRR